ncbi:cytochrome P450 [Melanogaster broomeanus]|nr:cytochrome P450 [Melanogaster broomeanus]
MLFQVLPPLLDRTTSYSLAGIVAATLVIAKLSKRTRLDAIPTVGPNTWLGCITFATNAVDLVQQGYEKHKPGLFKIAHPYRWIVIVTGRQHIQDMRNCADDELSLAEEANNRVKTEYTLGYEVHHNPYTLPIIRTQLTRNIEILYPNLRDEVVTAFEEILDLKGNEWKSMLALDTVQKVMCRTSNRGFVGFPLCRNPDWIKLNIHFIMDVLKAGVFIGRFPHFLAPLVARFLRKVPARIRHAMELLRPIIEERQKDLDEHSTAWADKPNDYLSLLMDVAEGSERSVQDLTLRILAVNFSGIHTSSKVITQALYNLAANPQYIQPLREEVETIIATEGWSRAALNNMRKIDSFLKETQRMEGIGYLSVSRRVMKDFTFSDGTVIPEGAHISAAARCMHLDNELYENADVFDPFRFSNIREEDGEEFEHQFVFPKPEYLSFGHGRHACPGRFFAAAVIKTMLAHIVVSYDVKLEENATRPQSLWVGTKTRANPTGKVVFRKRTL